MVYLCRTRTQLMTTIAIIALTVLGTILIFLLIIGSIGTQVSIEEMDADGWAYEIFNGKAQSLKSPKFEDLPDSIKNLYKSNSETKKELTDNELEVEYIQGYQYVGDLFKKLNSKDREPISDYKKNLPKYKIIIDKTPDKFLDYHFQNSIRDEQYELSQYISDVAKERGMILKADV